MEARETLNKCTEALLSASLLPFHSEDVFCNCDEPSLGLLSVKPDRLNIFIKKLLRRIVVGGLVFVANEICDYITDMQFPVALSPKSQPWWKTSI